MRSGKGIYTYPNGDKYLGEWKHDKFHGQGIINKIEFGKYIGKWKADLEHGQGAMTFNNGLHIDGEWKDGSIVNGTELWPNGDSYSGEFMDWEWHGQGELTLVDGHKMTGVFREDEPWETIEYDKDNVVIGKILYGVETINNSK